MQMPRHLKVICIVTFSKVGKQKVLRTGIGLVVGDPLVPMGTTDEVPSEEGQGQPSEQPFLLAEVGSIPK